MEYIVLSFKNAGWFPNNKRGSKDHVYEIDYDEKKKVFFTKKEKRNDIPSYVTPITIHHISNVLHVLFGERPKPSLRTTPIPKIDDIFDLAKNSYLKIDKYQYTNKNGVSFPITEIIKTKKSTHDSHLPEDNFETWVRLRNFLGIHFQFVFDKLKILLDDNNLLNKPLKNVVSLVRKYVYVENNTIKYKSTLLEEIVSFLKEKRKQPIINLFLGFNLDKNGNVVEAKHAMGNAFYPNKITLMGGIEKICWLSGKIIVPIGDNSDFWIKKLNKSKGFAKILDGGIVNIEDIISNINKDYLNGYINVSEISLNIN